MSRPHNRPLTPNRTRLKPLARCRKRQRHAIALLMTSLVILQACGMTTGSLVDVPPAPGTIQPTGKVSLKPLFCDEVGPFIWSLGGTQAKPDVSTLDIADLLKKPSVTIHDVRELVGDTDETVAQAKAINATGVRLCGWKVPGK